MRNAFCQALVATIAVSGFANAAPPPTAGNPTVTRPSAAPAQAVTVEATIDQRITDLHTRLQITAAQQMQWEQFSQVMRDNAKAMDQTFQTRAKAIPTMTATDNMRSYAQISAQHAQDMQKLAAAFQALYAAMSDSQKHKADLVFRDDSSQGKPARR
jgi:hypothetical protein